MTHANSSVIQNDRNDSRCYGAKNRCAHLARANLTSFSNRLPTKDKQFKHTTKYTQKYRIIYNKCDNDLNVIHKTCLLAKKMIMQWPWAQNQVNLSIPKRSLLYLQRYYYCFSIMKHESIMETSWPLVLLRFHDRFMFYRRTVVIFKKRNQINTRNKCEPL